MNFKKVLSVYAVTAVFSLPAFSMELPHEDEYSSVVHKLRETPERQAFQGGLDSRLFRLMSIEPLNMNFKYLKEDGSEISLEHDGVVVVERANFINKRLRTLYNTPRCFTYAFSKEEWANDPFLNVSPLMSAPIQFLKPKGYIPVNDPLQGDVMCYLDDGQVSHWGIYRGNNIVTSKFGCGDLCNHLLEVAPFNSNHVIFFRKENGSVNGAFN